MAWYRIAENVLNAIANAINAKTGHTAPMTPVEMVSEIQSIPTGGEKVYTKLGEATIAEPVNAINITITEQMKNCECLFTVCDSIVLSQADWIYPKINNVGAFGYTNKVDNFSGMFAFAPIKRPTGFTNRNAIYMDPKGFTVAAGTQANTLSVIGISAYTSGVTITSGKIEIWGYV